MNKKQTIKNLLSLAEIEINGSNPWDITINNEKTYASVLKNPELNLGETYMAGWWDCPKIDMFIAKLLRTNIPQKLKKNYSLLFQTIICHLFNFQSQKRAWQVGKQHYDLGNDLYKAMLDKSMTYTGGYWRTANNLEDAQYDKLDLVCKKLHLKPGMKILDVGCGWGSFAYHAATNYGVSVLGITISKEQQQLAQQRCQNLPVEIKLEDYRNLNINVDAIVSLGMFEHVGFKNYAEYFRIMNKCLIKDGLFLLQTIGSDVTCHRTNPWINNRIFPNGHTPSVMQIAKNIESKLVLEDWQNIGPDYDKTLMAWHNNINEKWQTLPQDKYDNTFQRMWNYYLLSCAGGFRSRDIELWQIVLSKGTSANTYLSIR